MTPSLPGPSAALMHEPLATLVDAALTPLEQRPPHALTPVQREILGQRFAAEALHAIHVDCELTTRQDRSAALRRLAPKLPWSADHRAHLDLAVTTLQQGRLTVNFKADQLIDPNGAPRDRELVNCFALKGKPGEPAGYEIGRASMEELTLGLSRLLQTSAVATYGRHASRNNALSPHPEFQRTSRPVYAALDYLHAPQGGAAHFGQSYVVLAERMKHIASYSPCDTFSVPLFRNAVSPTWICTYWHFPRLIGHLQNDVLGYSALDSVLQAARALGAGEPRPRPHPQYGLGGARNHIEAQIHGRIEIARDVDEVHVSLDELDQMPLPGSKDRLLAWMEGCNTTRRWARQRARWPDAPLPVPLATRHSLDRLCQRDGQRPASQRMTPADMTDESMLAKARYWPRFVVHRGGVDTGMLSDTGAD